MSTFEQAAARVGSVAWMVGGSASASQHRVIMSQVVFFVIASSIWLAGHVYVGQRLIKPLAPSVRVKWGFWAVWALLMLMAPVSLLLRRTVLPDDVGVAVNLVVFLQMGAFLMLFVASVLRDLGWGSLVGADRVLRWVRDRSKGAGAAAAGQEEGAVVGVILPGEPSRRAFLQNVFNLSMVGTVGTLTGIGYHEAHKKVGLNRVDVPVRGLPASLEGFTIVQISDTHIGPSLKGDFLEEVVETIGGVDADLIAVTGDLIDGYVPAIGHEVQALSRLKAPHGVYFVTGNHEHYWDAQAWIDHVRSLGLTVLNNEHRMVEVGGARLMIAGVTDHRAGATLEGFASDPHKAAAGGEGADLRVLLAHQPRSATEAAKAGFDVQLSGHTHGGQFYPWNFIAGAVHGFSAGLTAFGDLQVFVSRGTGYWGPPMRLGAPAEISVLTLRRA